MKQDQYFAYYAQNIVFFLENLLFGCTNKNDFPSITIKTMIIFCDDQLNPSESMGYP